MKTVIYRKQFSYKTDNHYTKAPKVCQEPFIRNLAGYTAVLQSITADYAYSPLFKSSEPRDPRHPGKRTRRIFSVKASAGFAPNGSVLIFFAGGNYHTEHLCSC
jgi:hypothetical protein